MMMKKKKEKMVMREKKKWKRKEKKERKQKNKTKENKAPSLEYIPLINRDIPILQFKTMNLTVDIMCP